MHRGRWTVILAAALTVLAAAQGTGVPPPPEGIVTQTLGNGLRLIYQPRYELEFTYVSVYLPLPANWLPRGTAGRRLAGNAVSGYQSVR